MNYLKPWEVLHLMPKQIKDFRMLVSSAFQYLVSENIRYAELRSSVIYLSHLFGICLEDTLNIIIDVLHEFSQIYFVDFSLIMTIQRTCNAVNDLQRILEAYWTIGKPKCILALDLAGDENLPV